MISKILRIRLCLGTMLLACSASVAGSPTVTATKTDNVTSANPGDTLTYGVTIGVSGADAENLSFSDPLADPNLQLVDGSLRTSPLARNDSFSAAGNIRIAIAAPGVLANDTDPDGVGPALTVTGPSTTAQGGNLTLNADGSFTYNPPPGFTGTDSFTYTLHDNDDLAQIDLGTVSITVTGMIWFIDNSLVSNGDGRLSSPFNSLSSFASINDGVDVPASHSFHPAAGDNIFLYRQTATSYTGPLTLLNNQRIIGQGASGALSTLTGVTPPAGSLALPATGGTRPQINASGGATLTLASGNDVRGLDVANSNGSGISGNNVGTLTLVDFDVSVSNGNALSTTGSGTVTATGANNDLSATTGTALNVSNVTIGVAGLTFKSITSTGGTASGIILSNTGAGGLTVTGDGANATKGGNGTGGTIANKDDGGADASGTVGTGIFLNNASNVTLRRMQINDCKNFGVRGLGVLNFILQYSTINGSNGDVIAGPEGCLAFGTSNPSGANGFANGSTATIDNCKMSGAIEHNVEFYQQSSSFSLTISNSDVKSNSVANGSDGIQLEMQGTASATVSVQSCIFDDNKSQPLQASANDTSVLNITVNECTVTRTSQGNEGFVLSNGLNADLIAQVTDNNISGIGGVAIFVGQTAGNATAASSLIATIKGNIITHPSTAVNHAIIAFLSSTIGQVSTSNILIEQNTITEHSTAGTVNAIRVDTPDANTSPSFTATIINNNVSVTDGLNGVQGIVAQARQSASGCFDIRGNTVTGVPGGIAGLRLRQVSPATANLEQGTSAGAAAGVLAVNNAGSSTEVLGTVTVVPNNTCSAPPAALLFNQPSPETTRLQDEMGPATSQSTSSDPEPTPAPPVGVLSQAELDVMVAAAIGRWNSTGLSAEQIQALQGVLFEVVDLPGWYLGEASGARVRVDNNAGGHGWFIDPTPEEDGEFAETVSLTRRLAASAQTAAHRIDLLTAVLHELGHAAGLTDSYNPEAREDIMYGLLNTGERRMPSSGQAAGFLPGSAPGTHFIIGPVSYGTVPAGKTLTITYKAIVNPAISPAVCAVSNQGTVTGNNFGNVVTDDPATGIPADPTVTVILVPPQITAVAALVRQQGTPGISSQVATVSDCNQAANTLTVQVDGAGSSTVNGVTVSGISIDASGNVSATVGASCTAANATFTLTVTDSSAKTANATLSVNVTANAVPTIGNYPDTTVSPGGNTTVTPDAAPADNGSIASVTATAAPGGFNGSFTGSTATGAITVTGAGPAGTYTITVTVTDNCGATATDAFTLTVNNPPTILQNDQARQQGSPASNSQIATVSDEDDDENTLTVTVNDGASATTTGVTVSNLSVDNTGAVTADVVADCTATDATFTLKVTDSAGSTATATLTVPVTADDAPTIGTYADVSVAPGASTNVSPDAAPADNGSVISVTTAISPSPFDGLLITTVATGEIEIENANPPGIYTITVTVTDNCGKTSTTDFTLTVNTPPTITPDDQARQQGSAPINSQIATVADGEDAESALVVTVDGNSSSTSHGVTVSNIAVDANGNVTADVEANCSATDATFILTVTDTVGGTDTAPLTVTVTDDAAPTVGEYPDVASNPGGNSIVTPDAAPADNGSIASVTAAASAGFTGTLSEDTATGAITIDAANPPGTYTIEVTVTDNCGATVARSFTLTVNNLPTIAPVGVIRTEGVPGGNVIIANVSDLEDAEESLVVTVNGLSSSTLNNVTVSNIAVDNAGVVTADVVANCNAETAIFTLTVTDSSGLSDEAELMVTVSPNPLPALAYPVGVTEIDQGQDTTIHPATPPNDNVSVTAIVVQEAGTFTGGIAVDNSTGVVALSNAALPGSHIIVIRVIDNCGDFTDAPLQVQVNALPGITAVPVTRTQGSPVSNVAIANVNDTEDPEETLLVTINNASSATENGVTVANLVVSAAGVVSADVVADCLAANASFSLKVTDSHGASATTALSVTVNDNPAPTLTYAAAVTVINAGGGSVINPVSSPADNGTVSSVLVQSQSAYTGSVLVNDSGVVTFSNAAPPGTHTITIRATDNCGATKDATLQVRVNALPAIAAVAVTRQQGSPALSVPIANVSDLEDNEETLSVSVNGGASATINGVTVSGITVSPAGLVNADVIAACNASTAAFPLAVTDSDGATADVTLTVTVDPNTAPALAYPAAVAVSNDGSTTVQPTTGPSDNGAIQPIVLLSVTPDDFTGTISVNPSSGVVLIEHAGPANTYQIAVRATDNCGISTDGSFALSVNSPPVAKCKDVTVSAEAGCTAEASIDDGSFDPDGDNILLSQTPPGPYQLGETEVTLTVTDSFGASSSCTATVIVEDNEAPSITNVSVTPAALWPPNHQMRDITVSYSVTDSCTVSSVLTVTSDEPESGTSAGDLAPDWEIIDANHVRLRAERSAHRNGRTYTILITSTDESGNVATASATVRVAHNITGPKVGAAYKIGTAVTFSGRFWDVPGSRHTAQWLFDGISINGTVGEPTASREGTVTGSYTFKTPGIYSVQLRVTDSFGQVSVADNIADLDALIVIYDPNGGYVTGGGWMASPPGACAWDPTLTGNADFGFVSKYFKSATNPKGETQFGLRLGAFQFNALNFDYLVIAGPKAQFKGFGKVNGDGGYDFILTLIDGQAKGGGGHDKLRLKISNKATGQLIYDTQPGAADDADPATYVGEGSTITIQAK